MPFGKSGVSTEQHKSGCPQLRPRFAIAAAPRGSHRGGRAREAGEGPRGDGETSGETAGAPFAPAGIDNHSVGRVF